MPCMPTMSVMSIIKKKLALVTAVVVGTVVPVLSNAAIKVVTPDTGGSKLDKTKLEATINAITEVMVLVAMGVVVIFIIVGAIQYMTAGGDSEKATKGRNAIINGVIGGVIIFALAWIISLIAGLGTPGWIFK
ncbi:MAG: hypothetical protein ABH833_04435 [Parcubacteria group bacterium]